MPRARRARGTPGPDDSRSRDGDPPAPRDCNTAIKVLTQYERLAEKLGIRIAPARMAELNRKRDAGTITGADLPATLRREWPGGPFDGKSLAEIRALCGRRSPGEPRQ